MKRNISLIALVFCVLAGTVLVGCNNESTPNPPTSTNAPSTNK